MMAKIYRFIFSILLICFAAVGKAQTIDGKLYTPFNNYYQWIGGKFNSNLNIPKVAATTGRDTGGIRYNLTDSLMYVWTGSQWRQVGQSIDTTSLSNRIDLRVKYSDTAAMLSPYLRTNIANATFIDSVFIQNDSIKYRKNGVSIASTPADTATVVKAYVTNAEAVTITKGQVVYIFGAQGDRASVKLAKNTSDTFSSKTLGIVRADIAAGQAGWVTTQGQVSGINLGAYSPGDILWLDSVAGGFTKTKPVAPKHGVFIGVVERANAGNGIIYVKPQNGVELSEVHDVLITSPTNNQVLAYTASTGIWENKSVTTALGYTPLNVTDTAAMLNGRLSGITLNTSSAIHTSPVTFSRVGGAWSGTLSLANQSGFTVFRRASGTGTPSFGTIDSSYFGGNFKNQVGAAQINTVQWTTGDSLYAYNKVRSGRHIMADIDYQGQSNQCGGWGDAWQFVSSPNALGSINANGINSLRASVTSSSAAAGVFQGQATLRTMSFIDATDPAVVNFRIRPNDLYDATDRFHLQIGFYDAPATNIANGYYFVYDKGQAATGSAASDNWQCVTANASTRTWTTTNTAVVEDAWVTLSIRITTGKVIFYVNGSIVAEHTTNITTANTSIFARIIKTAGTNARTMDIDYITFDQWYSTLR